MIRVAHHAFTVCILFMLNAYFASGNLEFWLTVGRDQPPLRTLGIKSLMSLPGRQHVTSVVTAWLLEELNGS